MLRRLDVRTRLVTVIAVPLALLLLVATPELLRRADQASAADRAVAAVRLSGDLATTVHALQQERTVGAAWRAGAGEQVRAALTDARAAVDASIEDVERGLAQVPAVAPGLGSAARAARERLTALPQIRRETDAAQSIVTWVDPLATLLDALMSVQEGLGTVVADAGMGTQLAQAALLARSKDAAAAQAAHLAAAGTWGELRGDQAGILASLRADELAYRTAYLVATSPEVRVARRAEVQPAEVTAAGRAVDELLRGSAVTAGGGLLRWLDLGTARQAALRQVEQTRTAEAEAAARSLGAASRRESAVYAALVGGGLLAAAGLALLAARSITRPLRDLTRAAHELASDRLPKLVDALRDPGEADERYLAAAVEPLEARSDDELARLARAFNSVQAVAVDVAAQQADLLRKGISDLYVNLARRNQALIERQIQLLDRLEASEQDPEVLENLFLLDHLATRMRRNAESLLVLAGADTSPRRARPIDVVDVVRAAFSEVEDFERVSLGDLATATVSAAAVSDVAHILAELLDNALHFSPPEVAVRIDGNRTGGGYQITITDHGVGIQPGQLAQLNGVLERPPVTGLALGRSLGCLVAARLAARHGIGVRLRAAEGGGVMAVVTLPRAVITIDADAPARHPDRATLAALDAQVPVQPVAPVGLPPRLRDALPSGVAFEQGLETLLDDEAVSSLIEAPVSGAVPDIGYDQRQALPRRVPGASAPEAAPDDAGDRVRRSPGEVRAMLSTYRAGLRAGRTSGASRAEEES